MKVLVDENVPLMTVSELRARGLDVLDVRGTSDEGVSDEGLWRMAQAQQRLLITTDKGFAAKRQESHWGMLIVHLRQPDRMRIHSRVMEAIGRFGENEWRDLVVMMRDRVMSVWPPR